MKYAVISINDRAKDNTDNTRKTLSNYEELNIRCVNGHDLEIIIDENSTHCNWKQLWAIKK